MAKPSVNPKIFAGQEVKKLKHDEYLLKFSQNSDELKKIINLILRIDLKKLKIEKGILWTDGKGYKLKIMSREEFEKELEISEKNLYRENTYKDLVFWKEVNVEITEKIECKDIKKWQPERPIMSGNYYIGSVDLYVESSFQLKEKLEIIGEHPKIVFEREIFDNGNRWFLFEFKPNIESFSEVIRQIKVYSNYFDTSIIPVCLTESDIKDYKEIFNSQGIHIFNIKDI